MPKIFSDAKKQEIYKIIRQNCLDLIQQKGYRQLNIKELTKITGISAGTFYSFYPSKEDLILAIMEESRHNLENRFFKLLESSGKITRSVFLDLYTFFFIKDEKNIFRYLSRDDLTAILLRSGKKQSFETIKTSMEKNIKYINKPKKNINFNAVINFTQLVNLCLENRDLMVKEEIDNTIRRLLENIADEIFEEEI